MRHLLVFLFLGVCGICRAQYNLADTFRHYLKEEPDFYLSLDGRNSFIRDQKALVDGFRFGLSYGGKVRLLTGLYRLRHPIERTYIYAPGTVQQEWRKQVNKFTYWGLSCDYVVYNRGRWKLAVPVQSGLGFGSRVERNALGEVVFNERFRFVPLTASLNASYRILPWFYASAGLGYRYALFSRTVSSDFSAPIYTYGLGIDIEWFWDRYLKELILKE